MATKNYIKAKQEGWLGLLDNDRQVYVAKKDLIIIQGGRDIQNQSGKTRNIILGNMCTMDVRK